jgi:prepilin-type N-terminal cleavage/methylation domain-containing protein
MIFRGCMKGLHGNHGISLIELLIGMVVAAIVISGAYRGYRYFVIHNARQAGISELQTTLTAVSQVIESDIRMAGYGIPGNGLELIDEETGNDQVTLYINYDESATVLTCDAIDGDTVLLVAGLSGARPDGWVMLKDPGKELHCRIGAILSDENKIKLASALSGGAFPYETTEVFYESRIKYSVENDGLVRTVNATPRLLARGIQNMEISVKNANGQVCTAGEQVRMLAMTLGSSVRQAAVARTMEVTLRNFE